MYEHMMVYSVEEYNVAVDSYRKAVDELIDAKRQIVTMSIKALTHEHNATRLKVTANGVVLMMQDAIDCNADHVPIDAVKAWQRYLRNTVNSLEGGDDD